MLCSSFDFLVAFLTKILVSVLLVEKFGLEKVVDEILYVHTLEAQADVNVFVQTAGLALAAAADDDLLLLTHEIAING
mgnify:CR=1 FL=1